MHDLIGTWRLVKTDAFDEYGAPITPPYGPKPMGRIDAATRVVLGEDRLSAL